MVVLFWNIHIRVLHRPQGPNPLLLLHLLGTGHVPTSVLSGRKWWKGSASEWQGACGSPSHLYTSPSPVILPLTLVFEAANTGGRRVVDEQQVENHASLAVQVKLAELLDHREARVDSLATVCDKCVHSLPSSGLPAGLEVEGGGGVPVAPDVAEPPLPRASVPHHHQPVTLQHQRHPDLCLLFLVLLLIVIFIISHWKLLSSVFFYLDDELTLLHLRHREAPGRGEVAALVA